MKAIKNLCKLMIITFFICLTFYFSYIEKTNGAIIFAIFTIFYTLLLYGNNFEIVELLGAKFKLKELNNSINELKALSKVVACISLHLLQTSNRIHSNEFDKIKQQFFENINEILNNVNISDDEKNKIYDKYWHKWVIFDYSHALSPLIHNTINRAENINEEDKNKLKQLCNPNNHIDLIKAYENSKNMNVIYDSDIEIQMEDFKYYIENKKHKNFDRWLNSEF